MAPENFGAIPTGPEQPGVPNVPAPAPAIPNATPGSESAPAQPMASRFPESRAGDKIMPQQYAPGSDRVKKPGFWSSIFGGESKQPQSKPTPREAAPMMGDKRQESMRRLAYRASKDPEMRRLAKQLGANNPEKTMKLVDSVLRAGLPGAGKGKQTLTTRDLGGIGRQYRGSNLLHKTPEAPRNMNEKQRLKVYREIVDRVSGKGKRQP